MSNSAYHDSLAGVDSVGGALMRALQADDASLKENVGKGYSVLQLGMDGLRRRARTMEMSEPNTEAAVERAYKEYAKGEALCESPIERAMLAALLTGQWAGFGTIPPRVHSALDKEEMLPEGDLLIVPQMAFMRYRLDFGVVLRLEGHAPQIVAVECDGADFHTEYRREHLRVAYLKSWGIPVFKFTGSQIYADPFEAARTVTNGVGQWRALL